MRNLDGGNKIIKNLASENSSGHDGISARFIKRMLDTITPSLTHSINLSLSTGIFPDRLKIAKVIPLFKKVEHKWLNINKLSLNVSKTKYIIFHHYQRTRM